MRRALITGVGGQDGYYLSKFLIDRKYEVVGCGRPGTLNNARGDELRTLGVRIVEVDLLERAQTERAIQEIRPQEIYNLAGHSFVPASWNDPVNSVAVTSWPVIHLLEAVRHHPYIRLYQSSTSEIFGLTEESPQNDRTPVAPANPYAAAKVFAHQIVQMYRQRYGIFVVSGILYNHESPRRPVSFVSRKITHAACRIRLGLEKGVRLGDIDAERDWGFAGDYVDAMWRMLQVETPEDFVVGTGIRHAVREICEIAFGCLGLEYRDYVQIDESLSRPDQPANLVADPRKAAEKLGWRAEMSFERLIETMVEADERICCQSLP